MNDTDEREPGVLRRTALRLWAMRLLPPPERARVFLGTLLIVGGTYAAVGLAIVGLERVMNP